MQLIVAIDGDRRQTEQLASLVRSRLGVELLQAASAGEALQALGDRVPDLIMTAQLLAPFDDAVLAEYLRDLGPSAAHVQTLRIPVFGTATKQAGRGLFSLRRKKPVEAVSAGCDPNVFADEIAVYLGKAAEQRQPVSAHVYTEAPVLEAADAPLDQPRETTDWLADSVEEPHTEPYTVRPAEYASEPIHDAVEPIEYASVEPVHEVVEPVEYVSAAPVHYSSVEPVEYAPVEPVHDVVEPVEYASSTPVHYSSVESVDYLAEPVAVALVEHAPVHDALAPSVLLAEAPPFVEAPSFVEEEAAALPPETPKTSSFEAALAAIRAAWSHEPRRVEATPAAEDVMGVVEAVDLPVIEAAADDTTTTSVEVPQTHALAPEELYELSVSPSLHDLDADLAAMAPPRSEPSPMAKLAPPRASEPAAVSSPKRKADKPRKRSKPRGRVTPGQPVQDEWGIFDPNQCGFSALVDKLDEVTEPGGAGRTTVRVISFS